MPRLYPHCKNCGAILGPGSSKVAHECDERLLKGRTNADTDANDQAEKPKPSPFRGNRPERTANGNLLRL